jgi:hypothetical protein
MRGVDAQPKCIDADAGRERMMVQRTPSEGAEISCQ